MPVKRAHFYKHYVTRTFSKGSLRPVKSSSGIHTSNISLPWGGLPSVRSVAAPRARALDRGGGGEAGT